MLIYNKFQYLASKKAAFLLRYSLETGNEKMKICLSKNYLASIIVSAMGNNIKLKKIKKSSLNNKKMS